MFYHRDKIPLFFSSFPRVQINRRPKWNEDEMKSRIELQFAFCRAFWNRFILFANFALYFCSLSFLFLLLPMIHRYKFRVHFLPPLLLHGRFKFLIRCAALLYITAAISGRVLSTVCVVFFSLEYIFSLRFCDLQICAKDDHVSMTRACVYAARASQLSTAQNNIFSIPSSFHWNKLKKKKHSEESL